MGKSRADERDMSDKAAEAAARLEQLKNAPAKAKRVAGLAALLGFIVLLRFLAAAYAGHIGWGRAVFYGIGQFVMFWLLGFSIQDRRYWAWWALLILILLQGFGALGQSMRLVRVILEGALSKHGREALSDWLAMAQLLVSAVILCFMFSREVWEHVRSKPAPSQSVQDD
jgi:ABC-type multidrug transport system fused ATPase/permease subunit